MNFSSFFIRRPIFAGVISSFIFLVGILAMYRLPVSEYPEVVPPTVVVRAYYPGANPKVIAATVASPLEQSINGVEHSLYMFSQATSDGTMTLTVTFKLGTDVDKAQVEVQNRVSQALPKLPEEVRRLGVTTVKASSDLTMVVHLISKSGRYDEVYIRNFANLQVKDVLSRLPGVGSVQIFGAGDYAMRVWIDPGKAAARDLTAGDIVKAIREQNVQVAAGAIGRPPLANPSVFELQINAKGRLVSEEEFGAIIVKIGKNGEKLYLRDVARVELGASEYALRSLLDNHPAVALPIFQLPGGNAIELSDNVRSTMKELSANFPDGLTYEIVYDPTVFVRDSIHAVVHTLFEAILLVVIVVIVFLQTWRASIIPLAAVPVSLVGTFAVMHALGFGINALSLFGLVLAIGIVVDDAIVVVENVERNIANGLTPFDATVQAMKEVTGPIIATALVLAAVFVPTAFISGLTGQFYKQFAITIAISTLISAFNSLTLSPALSALLLRGHDQPKDGLSRLMDVLFGWFFRPFNRFFAWAAGSYSKGVRMAIRKSVIALILYLGLLYLTGWSFGHVPTSFVPTQDKQYLIAFAQLPDAASLDRSDAVIRRMSEIALKHPGVASSVAFPGLSINGFVASPNSGIVFVTLKPFEERRGPDMSGFAIAAQLTKEFGDIKEAYIAIFPPPPVQGLGTIGGFRLQVEDRADLGYEELYKATWALIAKANQTPGLAGAFSSYQVNVPQLEADVDRPKALSQGVPLSSLFETMQIYLGSLYVNDFNRFGRTYQVIAQADEKFRRRPEDISRLKTRTDKGDMVALGSVLQVRENYGPDRAMHYNGYLSAEINGSPAPGYSSDQAQAIMNQLAKDTLPAGMGFEWTELTYQQILAGNTAIYVFPLCLLLVFLVLAAQYESFRLPIAIILIVPLTLLSALVGVMLKGGENNVFTQIGLIVLLGLAAKNAILIVEFAKVKQDEGYSPVEAAIEAARLRLRPILMTSIAFIAGVFPLVISHGAGSEMRQAMGVAVFAGMIGVTFFGLFLTPVFYRLVMTFGRRARAVPVGGPRPPAAPVGIVHLLLAALVLGGATATVRAGVFTVGPDYQRPTNAIPAQYRDATPWRVAAPADMRTKGPWWELFRDEDLNRLVERATTNNQSLRAAFARVNQARAIAREARADFFPKLSFDPDATRQRYSPNQKPAFGALTVNAIHMPLDLSYEVDLWGRVRRGFEAARADASARQSDLAAAGLSVQAEVAHTYFTLRSLDNVRGILRETLELRRQARDLIQVRFDAGSAPELDLARANTELESAESDLQTLDRNRNSLQAALAVLTGAAAPEFTFVDGGHYTNEAPVVPPGLPAELLERRPDVASAERAVAAANARIGMARAAYFPVLRLTGSGGFLSADAQSLFNWDSRVWSLGPSLSIPLFTGGRGKAETQRARAAQEEATANYRQLVLVALAEVQEQLTDLHLLANQGETVGRAWTAARRAAYLARARYEEGASSYLEVVDAERAALGTRREAARVAGQKRLAMVQLIKALGGSWESAAEGKK